MHLLAIDTSTQACSVALYTHGEVIEKFALTPQAHLEALTPMIHEILAEGECTLNRLDALAFGAGPGAFTGLRIACSFIQGMALATGLPIAQISTLEALALNVADEYAGKQILTVLDARMKEVYAGLYQIEEGTTQRVLDDNVYGQENLAHLLTNQIADQDELIVVGQGIDIIENWGLLKSNKVKLEGHLPRAGEIALLGVRDYKKGYVLDAEHIQPIYLRHHVAKTLIEQQADKKHKLQSNV